MKPLERQNVIIEMAKKHEVVQVADISRICQVSEMTIYRDVQKLEQAGHIHKTSRGITALRQKQTSEESCSYCHKPAGGRLAVQLVFKDNTQEKACCSHCALLRYTEKREDTVQILCRDFLLDTTINAKHAAFVINSELPLFCCSPQPLVFQRQMDAERFAAGFGGSICSFEEAVSKLTQDMSCGCSVTYR
ncbi:DeoR family transcriptional regulator [Alkalicoccus daliensis]|uniref:DeoR-like helix-turn-helix domain-containing protein n=1 Tax=Alkalicoccus daliensis TaxID=745820 RepID=A0A1H0FRM4_9BACI|nr:DeoR family transcriptional regulator [Alkalicoccus daliensis]SDN97297.1 DeoR-like helix-turn-helix domain-containing protein [Alkalicoccus daliensis]